MTEAERLAKVKATAVRAAGLNQLGREFGESGAEYWENDWQNAYDAAIGQGKSVAQAEAAAAANVSWGLSGTPEAKTFAEYGVARGAETIRGLEGNTEYQEDTSAYVPDWYTAGSGSAYGSGTRDANWEQIVNDNPTLVSHLLRGDENTGSGGLNYQYGVALGRAADEHAKYWVPQKQAALDHYMSEEGGGYSFETASQIADAHVMADIRRSQEHDDFLDYGSTGYSGALNVDTLNADGSTTNQDVYLNMSELALEHLADEHHLADTFGDERYRGFGSLGTTGTEGTSHLITKGNLKNDPYYIDDDGNVVTGDAIPDDYTGDLITDSPASAFSWIPDSTVPGGYRKVPATILENKAETGDLENIGGGASSTPSNQPTHSSLALSDVVAGMATARGSENTLVSGGYESRTGNKAFAIPTTGVKNIDVGSLLPGHHSGVQHNLNLRNLDINSNLAGTGLVYDEESGKLVYTGTTSTGGNLHGLGLKAGETLSLTNADGTTFTDTGKKLTTNPLITDNTEITDTIIPVITDNNGGETGSGGDSGLPPIPTASNIYYGMGGGNKTIVANTPPPSKTAKDQIMKEPVKMINQAPKRDQYNKIRAKGARSIPGIVGGLSIPVG